MSSKIDIISSALLLLGHDSINSLTDPGYPNRVAQNTYDNMVQFELTKSNWTFARVKVQLAQLVTDPVDEFDNAFQLPADRLKVLFIRPRVRYKIYRDQIFTNASGPMFLDYIANVGEDEWPPSFTHMTILALAANWGLPIREGVITAKLLEARYNEASRTARTVDSTQNPQDPIRSNPFVAARLGNDHPAGF